MITYCTLDTSALAVHDERPARQRRTIQQKADIRRRARIRLYARRIRSNIRYAVFFPVCMIIASFCLVQMIQLETSITTTRKHVSSLEIQVAELTTTNNARYREVTSSVDLDYIKDVAINQLGMTYVVRDQIEYYSMEKNNCMKNYSSASQ